MTAPRPAIDRIAVVRALPGVGDLLCAVPALRALRTAHPRAHVTLVGLPAARWFVARYGHLVDGLLPVAGLPGLPEVRPCPAAARRFYAAAAARHFDLALQLHGDGTVTNPLTTMLAARRAVTAHRPGQWTPPGSTIPYATGLPEIRRLLAVTEAAGCPPRGDVIDLPVTDVERSAADALCGGRSSPYICLHPGASRPGNRWPATAFAAVGDRWAAAGYRVVLTGTAVEASVVARVDAAMATRALVLCGRTDVGLLAALFAAARLVVSNDTGAAHVAAGVGTPSVVVFPADGDPDRWAPLDRARHRVVTPPDGATWPRPKAVLDAAPPPVLGREAV